MSEIKKEPIVVPPSWEWVNTSDDDAVIFTDHSHRDILRFVISELGEEIRFHVDDLLKDDTTPYVEVLYARYFNRYLTDAEVDEQVDQMRSEK